MPPVQTCKYARTFTQDRLPSAPPPRFTALLQGRAASRFAHHWKLELSSTPARSNSSLMPNKSSRPKPASGRCLPSPIPVLQPR